MTLSAPPAPLSAPTRQQRGTVMQVGATATN